jgi:hypothetical protein
VLNDLYRLDTSSLTWIDLSAAAGEPPPPR